MVGVRMKEKFIKNGVFSLEYDKETLRDIVLELQEENKKQKEVIDKIFSRITLWKMEDITMEISKVLDDLLDILKEVQDEKIY